MSRAVNVDAPLETVSTLCDRHGIAISTIEPLQSGGTRVVLINGEGAAEFRRRMKDKLITGTVVRSGIYLGRPPLPGAR